MQIKWNEVTTLSQVVAIVLFVVIFFVGFIVGRKFENISVLDKPLVAKVKFACDENKIIKVDFYKNFVHLETNTIKSTYLPQTISASGSRYANSDESIVFWNKGGTAFITEQNPENITHKNCLVEPKNR